MSVMSSMAAERGGSGVGGLSERMRPRRVMCVRAKERLVGRRRPEVNVEAADSVLGGDIAL